MNHYQNRINATNHFRKKNNTSKGKLRRSGTLHLRKVSRANNKV
jgi:hypothetical protein